MKLPAALLTKLPSRKRLIQIGAGLAAAAVLVPVVFVVFILPHIEIAGAADPPPVFEYIEAFGIEKSTADRVKYTVNNSVATFDLDVAKADAHCGRLFRDYASALEYCRSTGLAAIPSVQLVQGKCKQFDDGLCAALELAVQEGLPQSTGKRAALAGLARRLISMLGEATGDARPAIERALVHVAAALSLGGTDFGPPPGVAAKVAEAKEDFLAEPARSRPVGFWTWSKDLGALFMQDRFLTQGLRLPEEAGAAVALSVAISGDTDLASAFDRFNAFDAKITNPLTYVDQDELLAPQAGCVLFGQIAKLLPRDVPPNEALAPDSVAEIAAELGTRFGEDAGFALVAYSESKEYGLLRKLFSGNSGVSTMQLIIDAVRSGRLSLEPRPDSGWYDYQWHALETLLLPERARESAKLKLSEAYKERLKNAFAAILTKHRETHIKHLPVLTLGGSLGEPEPPPKVEIGPEFSVEPTATVYLRMARGYAFLRNALRAVLGRDALRGLRRFNPETPPVKTDLDGELRETTLRLYGLYDKLCVEIGTRPDYLEGELSAEEITQAKQVAAKWLASLESDLDLAVDTRVVAPIAYDPIANTMRSWATGGVKLQRVAYEYRDEPKVGGRIEPVFVATHYYLATDIFLEFDRAGGTPLTRKEFRALCDAHDNEASLRRALGAIEIPKRGGFPYVMLIVLALAASGLGALGWKYRSRLRALQYKRVFNRRTLKVAGIGAGALILLWILALMFFQGYRTRFLVKYVARINPNAGVMVEMRSYYNKSPGHIEALVDLLGDRDPQVRYLAARFLDNTMMYGNDEAEDVLRRVPSIRARLRELASDDVPEVAAAAIRFLGSPGNPEDVDFLLSKLKTSRHVDAVCASLISSLGAIGDTRALDAVLPFTKDPRPGVRWRAIRSLGRYDDERAARRLVELVKSPTGRRRSAACSGILLFRDHSSASAWEGEFSRALLDGVRDSSLAAGHRRELAAAIAEDRPEKVQAYLSLLQHPSPDEDGSVSRRRKDATRALGRIGPAARAAIPALKEALDDPDPRVRKAAKEALEKVERVGHAGDPAR